MSARRNTDLLRVSRTKAAILSFIQTHSYRPVKGSSDAVERSLGRALANYIWPGSKSFDPEFRAAVDQMCPPQNKKQTHKLKLLEWIESNGPVPKDHELYIRYRTYRQPSGKSYDPAFTQRADELMSRHGQVRGRRVPRSRTATHMTYGLLKSGCRDGVELMTELLSAMRSGRIRTVSSAVCFAVVVKAALRVGLGFKSSKELVRAFPRLKITPRRVLAIEDLWSKDEHETK